MCMYCQNPHKVQVMSVFYHTHSYEDDLSGQHFKVRTAFQVCNFVAVSSSCVRFKHMVVWGEFVNRISDCPS